MNIDTLPIPVPTFYTTLHKNIYDNFLKKNRGLISSKDSLVFFRGFSSSSMPKLRELYTRVNAMLKYLYSFATIPKEGELDIDRQLVEQELESAMNYYYTEIYKEPCFSYCEKANSSVVLRHNEDNTLSIKLANHLRPYAATPLSQAYDKLHEDHAVILDEKGKLKAELEDKDRVIARQTEEAACQTEVIALQRDDAARQAEVIARQCAMIAQLQAMMKENQAIKAQSQNAFFSPSR